MPFTIKQISSFTKRRIAKLKEWAEDTVANLSPNTLIDVERPRDKLSHSLLSKYGIHFDNSRQARIVLRRASNDLDGLLQERSHGALAEGLYKWVVRNVQKPVAYEPVTGKLLNPPKFPVDTDAAYHELMEECLLIRLSSILVDLNKDFPHFDISKVLSAEAQKTIIAAYPAIVGLDIELFEKDLLDEVQPGLLSVAESLLAMNCASFEMREHIRIWASSDAKKVKPETTPDELPNDLSFTP